MNQTEQRIVKALRKLLRAAERRARKLRQADLANPWGMYDAGFDKGEEFALRSLLGQLEGGEL